MTSQDIKSGAVNEDEVDKLSLSIMPLTNTTLKSAQLIKNAAMETMVELVNDPLAGSLQIRPQDISANFAISKEDQTIIDKLATLNSYDVYSLRTNLKTLGIKVETDALELSAGMKERLQRESLEFSRPLIRSIFGDGDLQDDESLQKAFRHPDRALVAKRLKTMAEKTSMPVEDVPAFLSSYNDLYLSGVYYRHTFETIKPSIARFKPWLEEVKAFREVSTTPRHLETCRKAENNLTILTTSMEERMDGFKKEFEAFWSNINKKSFDKLRRRIESSHASMGAVLCGLMVKMRDWSMAFPDNRSGSPGERMKYVAGMEPALEKLKNMEAEARLMDGSF